MPLPPVLRLRHTLLIGLWVLCWGNWAHSDDRVGEHDLKAAYVFNFIQFIDWPDNEPGAERDWVICVSPFSPLKRPLTALEGKTIRKGQPVRVRLLEINELRSCRIAVLHHTDVPAVLRALRSMPPANGILTIAEEAAPSSPEIMITLAQQNGRIVFGVNTDATSRAGLTVSSRLLRLAKAGK